MGRTGKLFAHQWSGVAPDVMATAKALGGGFPVAACMATENAAQGMGVGSHGSTFGGNPLAMAVANAVLDVMLADGFLDNVVAMGEALERGLQAIVAAHPAIAEEVRGSGLLRGIKLAGDSRDMVSTLRRQRAVDGRRRRQRHPHAAAADRRAGAYRRGDGDHRRRLRRRRVGRCRVMSPPRHFLDLDVIEADGLREIHDLAIRIKQQFKAGDPVQPLAGKTLAMIFEAPSTRTRVSFEVGMRQLGGQTVVLSPVDTHLGRGETIADTARVLSRYVDIIMIRTTDHAKLLELAEHASVPVINGLTDRTHPCQLMADLMTFEEHRGLIAGRTVTWVGDGNNMAVSWTHAAARFGFTLKVACPRRSGFLTRC